MWIEITLSRRQTRILTVAPFAGVWIEIHLSCVIILNLSVAPFAGVWIEIGRNLRNRPRDVAPFAGVWIEINWITKLDDYEMSHPSRVCGLKYMGFITRRLRYLSHPSRVCGLKCINHEKSIWGAESHPSRVCGLKYTLIYKNATIYLEVAPFAGEKTCKLHL